jgi:RNA polymerase-interacting CarD/CdnL/TRCF family regulator
MMEQEMSFDIGAWVVHNHYGVGQIKDIEIKPIHGEPTECFVVQVKDGAFWLPIDSVENPRIRPVASQEIMRKVIKNLRRKPGNLKKDKKYWTQQIKQVPPHGDLLTISQLIRDLSAQKAQKRLTDTQIRALSNFKDRLLLEWSTITGTDIEKLRPQFNEYIQESTDKIEIK